GREGLVTVGITRDGAVAFVGSTLARDSELSATASRSPLQNLLAAALDVGIVLGELTSVVAQPADFLSFRSSLPAQDIQRVRLRALPVPGEGVRPVHEVTLLDSTGINAVPRAFILHIDAVDGRIWTRDNAVQHFAHAEPEIQAPGGEPISGTTPAGACGEPHAFTIDGDNAGQIIIGATATSGADMDITLQLFAAGELVAEQDLLTSPEVLTYAPAGGVPPGNYSTVVCPFEGAAAPEINYQGAIIAAPASPGGPLALNPLALPSWDVFPVSPIPEVNAPAGTDLSEDIRETWCWLIAGEDPTQDNDLGGDPAICDRSLANAGSRAPWDALSNGIPTFTTHGNNASTAVSNINFIAPDTVFLRPVALDRQYRYEWSNSWYETGCAPTNLVNPAANFNDFMASTVNLFVQHNRVHDWSYLLGWTEINSNLQFDNYGLTSPLRQNDGEIGSAQAGRLTVNGRDNANQLTLQDGIPGITNQYLWQALPGAIYAPCVDGGYDLGIIVHEVTHATSNRLTGGPDASLGGGQAGKMGESWSDLAAVEFIFGQNLETPNNPDPFAVAGYATGDTEVGIRNYSIANSPLTYGSMEYDPSGITSPHSDSEIWGATNFTVRQALIDKYNADFPVSDKARQLDCAEGREASTNCPGNRRWAHLLYDGMLLQPASPSMLDSRDAMLAADVLRYDGANLRELWDAFAQRGMGASAFSDGPSDTSPVPGFDSPLRDDEAVIRFAATGSDGGNPVATVYVGDYEARATPSADLDDTTGLGDTVAFVPGTYRFIVAAPGYGLQRFEETFTAGESRTLTFPLKANYASDARGAVASGDGDSDADLAQLIDETEATSWSSTDGTGTASEGKGEGAFVEGRQVTVRLAEPVRVESVNVSALPMPGQSRFSMLRSFDLLACDNRESSCASDADFAVFFESPDDAFPAGPLRPTAPKQNLRTFDAFTPVEASHVRIRVRDSQCTGNPFYQRERFPVNGDPTNDPDCDTGSNLQLQALALFVASNLPNEVRINELQVFGTALGSDSRVVDGAGPDARPAGLRGGSVGIGLLLLLSLSGAAAYRRRQRRR
ncbi:MAG: M36 family metallopeptidase, partial [Oceanococcaceae bacterium]